MKNSEGYHDPTASNAMSWRPKRQKQIVASPPKKRVKSDAPVNKTQTVYYAKPVYVSKKIYTV